MSLARLAKAVIAAPSPRQSRSRGPWILGEWACGSTGHHPSSAHCVAVTRCSAVRPLAQSWLRRTLLPSIAIMSGGSGQQARTQSMKQAANRSGSIRFIMMLSQRPEETPHSNGRNRRKNPRRTFPNQRWRRSCRTRRSWRRRTKTPRSACEPRLPDSACIRSGKSNSAKPQSRRPRGFVGRGVHQTGSKIGKPMDTSLSATRKSPLTPGRQPGEPDVRS